jgi:zona occludens toxin
MATDLGGVHTLITGLNGHGKTLFAVAEILRYVPGSKLTTTTGASVERRLCVSGIPGLMLEHELVDAEEVNPERFEDKWREHVREPGTPPLDVHRLVNNWWTWAQPGDVIVVDEAQRCFRPFASGRRVPMFIEKLETARHYGVQFLYLTQGPALLHTNVRNLVGPHLHVERIFGTARVLVREWPKCSNPDRIKFAATRYWRHDRKAFQLYTSAQLHTRFGARLPFAVFGLVGALVVLAVLGWYLKARLFPGAEQLDSQAKPASAASAPRPVPLGAMASAQQPGTAGALLARPLAVGAPVKDREPYAGIGLHLAGAWFEAGREVAYFSMSIDGATVGTLTLAQLGRAGYAWRSYGPCAGVLIFGERERAVTCDAPMQKAQPLAAPLAPQAGASAPSV